MRWLVDTSAWSRRDDAAIGADVEKVVHEGGELVLSPAVLLELMRGPRGQAAVADERQVLTEAMTVISADAETFELAAETMERLAGHAREAHRKPVADLITAALAHQRGLGVIHCDGDFAEVAEHGGLVFEHRYLAPDPTGGSRESPAARQRALKKELAQALHQAPVDQAEEFLERVVAEARELKS